MMTAPESGCLFSSKMVPDTLYLPGISFSVGRVFLEITTVLSMTENCKFSGWQMRFSTILKSILSADIVIFFLLSTS